MKKLDYLWHLAKRTYTSYRAQPLNNSEQEEVSRILLPTELELWHRFPTEDQRHSYIVMKRFQDRMPSASPPQLRAALLHDIGKIAAPLSTTMRVVATFVGPRTAAFRAYHDHEEIGLQMLAGHSDLVTIQLLRDMYSAEANLLSIDNHSSNPVVAALIAADNI